MPTKTDDKKKREAAAERERAARRKRVNARLAELPSTGRDAVQRDAQRREAAHKGPRVTAVQWLEEALDAFEAPENKEAGTNLRTTGSGALRIQEGTTTGDEPPKSKPRPKGPREKSTPKETGRPAPETKDPDELASNAKRARGGAAAITATATVTVPDGETTAYCKACDTDKPEAEFWPKNRTAKSKRRHTCRPCYNAAWAKWNAEKKAAV